MHRQQGVFTHKHEWMPVVDIRIDGTGGQEIKWNKIKQERSAQKPHVYCKMWNLQKVLTWRMVLIVVVKGKQVEGR